MFYKGFLLSDTVGFIRKLPHHLIEAFKATLEEKNCNSIVALRDGDVLKVHAHTMTPADVLTLCQIYGEFLEVKIENMSLQHSERTVAEQKKKKIHRPYGVIAVASGEGMHALFSELGADIIIDGGQTAVLGVGGLVLALGGAAVEGDLGDRLDGDGHVQHGGDDRGHTGADAADQTDLGQVEGDDTLIEASLELEVSVLVLPLLLEAGQPLRNSPLYR
mgnify:CR=1 FL=1